MEPHQHHHPGHAHPPATVSPSILRLSALERLAAVAVVVAALWGAVAWASGGLGIAFGTAGFLGLSFRPEWLAQLLGT